MPILAEYPLTLDQWDALTEEDWYDLVVYATADIMSDMDAVAPVGDMNGSVIETILVSGVMVGPGSVFSGVVIVGTAIGVFGQFVGPVGDMNGVLALAINVDGGFIGPVGEMHGTLIGQTAFTAVSEIVVDVEEGGYEYEVIVPVVLN